MVSVNQVLEVILSCFVKRIVTDELASTETVFIVFSLFIRMT
jgi:hypothetical protein